MEIQFPTTKVCQYCDKLITSTGWVSFAQGFTATLCSPTCKELYERASSPMPKKRWDVV